MHIEQVEALLWWHYQGDEAKRHVADWQSSCSQQEEIHGRLQDMTEKKLGTKLEHSQPAVHSQNAMQPKPHFGPSNTTMRV